MIKPIQFPRSFQEVGWKRRRCEEDANGSDDGVQHPTLMLGEDCEALMLNILGTVVIGLDVDRGERRPRPERQIDPAIPENLHDE